MEEFFINEVICPSNWESLTSNVRDRILEQNKQVFEYRLNKMHAYLKKNKYKFRNDVVNKLLELGEINFADAIELEFYSTLSKDEKIAYYLQLCIERDVCLTDYLNGVRELNRYIARQNTHRILIGHYIDKARQNSLPKGLKGNLSEILNTVMNRDMYLNNAIIEMSSHDTEKSQFCAYTMQTPNNLHKNIDESAKRAVTLSKRLDYHQYLDGETCYLYLWETLSILRNNNLSKEQKKALKDMDKNYNKKRVDLYNCVNFEL